MMDDDQGSVRSMSTEQLLEIWNRGDPEGDSADTLALVHDLLRVKGAEIPERPQAKSRSRKNDASAIRLPSKSNALLRVPHPGKTEIRFPRDGSMQHGRFEFRDQDDLMDYITGVFQLPTATGSRWRFSRRGKYQRVDEKGEPILTFGDPVIDLITNRHGITVVGGDVYEMRERVLTTGGSRGGVRSIDLGPHADDIRRMQLAKGVLEMKDFALLECSSDAVTLATRNPSSMTFTAVGGALMMFAAWRTNLFFYWSMGSWIETWNSSFQTANIDSKYGVFGGNSNICNVLHRDSDSDSTDDYVDEWEAGSFWSTVPDGHSSHCRASWKGMFKSGTVSKGSCGAWNG